MELVDVMLILLTHFFFLGFSLRIFFGGLITIQKKLMKILFKDGGPSLS